MAAEQAKAIWAFVRKHWAEIGAIVCHCEQGMSRSPAVAIALAEVLGGDARKLKSNSNSNQHVYCLMRQAIEKGN